MNAFSLLSHQNEIITRPRTQRLFLEGPAGSGKTTTGVGRLLYLLQENMPAQNILVLVPQRTLAAPYQAALQARPLDPGGQVTMLTVGGLARRMIDLFWPFAAEKAGFAHPEVPPAFLTMETALYYMSYLVRPRLEEGFFDSVAMDRNRIYSQILDNLEKAALVGFPHTQIGARLQSAWKQSTAQTHIYENTQECANLFRDYCLQNNLLDFSLQVEIFRDILWADPACQSFLHENYHHLITDNVEENNPFAHDILRQWIPYFDSALVIYDQDAGYRRFLGANPTTGHALVEVCDEHHIFVDSLVTNPVLQSFSGQISRALERPAVDPAQPISSEEWESILHVPERTLRFYPQMIEWVVDSVDQLIQTGTPPAEIVILAPFLPDSLRFALADRLEARGISHHSHRPSRSLRDEPVTHALLTLAALAYPQWGLRPSDFEVAYALIQSIEGIDLVRAQLLATTARAHSGQAGLLPFERIRPDIQERVTFLLGSRYETLRLWLETAQADPIPELDFFLNRLFGEVLSRPGFAFHANYQAGTICANLIESARKFRQAVEDRLPSAGESDYEEPNTGKEYMLMIRDGILAAQYIQSWQPANDDSVFIAPAYTFLLANRPVDHQFWLDIGSQAWAERINQPLTHPYILSREWDANRVWTDIDEYEYNREALHRLVLGLTRRCRKRLHLAFCDLNEGGYESRGLLLRALNIAMQQSRGYANMTNPGLQHDR